MQIYGQNNIYKCKDPESLYPMCSLWKNTHIHTYTHTNAGQENLKESKKKDK